MSETVCGLTQSTSVGNPFIRLPKLHKKIPKVSIFCRDLKFAKSVTDVQIHLQMYFYVFVFLIREHPKLDKKHEASVQNLKELVSSVPEKGGLFSDTCTRSCQYLFIISLVQ